MNKQEIEATYPLDGLRAEVRNLDAEGLLYFYKSHQHWLDQIGPPEETGDEPPSSDEIVRVKLELDIIRQELESRGSVSGKSAASIDTLGGRADLSWE